jgi:polyhydroxyalkanoate synthesis repressor PhaR
MNVDPQANEPLQVKKYPNRRYYDATRSCHVTLKDLHDLIQGGQDVRVTDSRSGEDITNAVLLQVLLEKDHPKIDFFPSAILHFMIRSNPQSLQNYSEQVFGPFFQMMASSGKQFDIFLRELAARSLGGLSATAPLEWTKMMMGPFSVGRQPSPPPPAGEASEETCGAYDPEAVDPDTVADLRSQLADLNRRLKNLTDNPAH